MTSIQTRMLQASQGRLVMEELSWKRGRGAPWSVRKKWATMTYFIRPILGEMFYTWPPPHDPKSKVDWKERLLVVPGHSLSSNLKKEIIFKGPLRQNYLLKGNVRSIGARTVYCTVLQVLIKKFSSITHLKWCTFILYFTVFRVS